MSNKKSLKNVSYPALVDNLIHNFKNLKFRMSIEVHFLYSHLDFFWKKLDAVSGKHEEIFHQDTQIMKKY